MLTGVPLSLSGAAWTGGAPDLEGVYAYGWASSQQGLLGNEASLVTSGLALGDHLLTLSARAPDGSLARGSVGIQVVHPVGVVDVTRKTPAGADSSVLTSSSEDLLDHAVFSDDRSLSFEVSNPSAVTWLARLTLIGGAVNTLSAITVVPLEPAGEPRGQTFTAEERAQSALDVLLPAGVTRYRLTYSLESGPGEGSTSQLGAYQLVLTDGNGLLPGGTNPIALLSADQDGDGLHVLEERDLGTLPAKADSDEDGLDDGQEHRDHGTDPLAHDTDGDGLGDGTEVLDAGTDPLRADTDGDGLGDGDEVNVHSTDPLHVDTDRDGLTDGQEVLEYGLSPLLQDTDGDGLGDGSEVLTHGSSPLSPDTDQDGLGDAVEATYSWLSPVALDADSDGIPDPILVSTFGYTDPSLDTDGDGLSNLAELRDAHTLWDVPDTDGDELTDGAEVLTHGTDPNKPDTDTDTLTDGEEVALGTNPLLADTDDDGLRDDREVRHWGTDPLNPDTDGDLLPDGDEANLRQGDPLLADTDGDGLDDWTELSVSYTNPWIEDSDGDGLSDGYEVAEGLNPRHIDHDGDGIDDGEDVRLGLDPDSWDTDGDGIPDLEEIRLGLLPGNPDSDNDGVSDGLELSLPSNPWDPDTDGDGLMDADELRARTQPWRADTDRDGIRDRDEVAYYPNYDPRAYDSDEDGVPDGREAYGVPGDSWDQVGISDVRIAYKFTLKPANRQVTAEDLGIVVSVFNQDNPKGYIEMREDQYAGGDSTQHLLDNLFPGESALGAWKKFPVPVGTSKIWIPVQNMLASVISMRGLTGTTRVVEVNQAFDSLREIRREPRGGLDRPVHYRHSDESPPSSLSMYDNEGITLMVWNPTASTRGVRISLPPAPAAKFEDESLDPVGLPDLVVPPEGSAFENGVIYRKLPPFQHMTPISLGLRADYTGMPMTILIETLEGQKRLQRVEQLLLPDPAVIEVADVRRILHDGSRKSILAGNGSEKLLDRDAGFEIVFAAPLRSDLPLTFRLTTETEHIPEAFNALALREDGQVTTEVTRGIVSARRGTQSLYIPFTGEAVPARVVSFEIDDSPEHSDIPIDRLQPFDVDIHHVYDPGVVKLTRVTGEGAPVVIMDRWEDSTLDLAQLTAEGLLFIDNDDKALEVIYDNSLGAEDAAVSASLSLIDTLVSTAPLAINTSPVEQVAAGEEATLLLDIRSLSFDGPTTGTPLLYGHFGLQVADARKAEELAPEAGSGPSDASAPSHPATTYPLRIRSFVAIGDSLTAGMQDLTLLARYQEEGLYKQVAERLGIGYRVPLIGEPGAPLNPFYKEEGVASESSFRVFLHMVSLAKMNPGSLIRDWFYRLLIETPPGNRVEPEMQPTNLAVPGVKLADALDRSGRDEDLPNGVASVGLQRVLAPEDPVAKALDSSKQAKATMVNQARVMNPSLVLLWLGANDVLGAIETGRLNEVTPLPEFQKAFDDLTHHLPPNADILIADVPPVDVTPHLVPVGERVAALPLDVELEGEDDGTTSLRSVFVDKTLSTIISQGVGSMKRKGGGRKRAGTSSKSAPLRLIPPGSFVPLSVLVQNVLNLPQGIVMADLPFDFNPSELVFGEIEPTVLDRDGERHEIIVRLGPYGEVPYLGLMGFPGILETEETFEVRARVNQFNGLIRQFLQASAGGSRTVAQVPVHDMLARPSALGLTSSQVGLFSHDGLHPSGAGQTLLADLFVQVINQQIERADEFGGFEEPLERPLPNSFVTLGAEGSRVEIDVTRLLNSDLPLAEGFFSGLDGLLVGLDSLRKDRSFIIDATHVLNRYRSGSQALAVFRALIRNSLAGKRALGSHGKDEDRDSSRADRLKRVVNTLRYELNDDWPAAPVRGMYLVEELAEEKGLGLGFGLELARTIGRQVASIAESEKTPWRIAYESAATLGEAVSDSTHQSSITVQPFPWTLGRGAGSVYEDIEAVLGVPGISSGVESRPDYWLKTELQGSLNSSDPKRAFRGAVFTGRIARRIARGSTDSVSTSLAAALSHFTTSPGALTLADVTLTAIEHHPPPRTAAEPRQPGVDLVVEFSDDVRVLIELKNYSDQAPGKIDTVIQQLDKRLVSRSGGVLTGPIIEKPGRYGPENYLYIFRGPGWPEMREAILKHANRVKADIEATQNPAITKPFEKWLPAKRVKVLFLGQKDLLTPEEMQSLVEP